MSAHLKRHYGLTEEQLAFRRTGVGASEVAALMGRSTFAGPMDVWRSKTDPDVTDVIGELPYVKWGNRLESVVLDAYEEEMDRLLLRGKQIGTLTNPKFPRLLCSPDGIDVTGVLDQVIASAVEPHTFRLLSEKNEFHRVVQGKTCRFAERHVWGAQGTDEIPDAYLLQVQTEMGVTGLVHQPAHLPVLFGGNDFRIYSVEFNADLFGMISETVQRFWVDHVETKTPPSIDGSKAWSEWLSKTLKERKNKFTRSTFEPTEIALIEKLASLKSLLEQAQFDHDGVANQIKKLIGESYGIKVDGFGKVLYTGGGRENFTEIDWKAVVDAWFLRAQAYGGDELEAAKKALADATTKGERFTVRALRFYPEKERV